MRKTISSKEIEGHTTAVRKETAAPGQTQARIRPAGDSQPPPFIPLVGGFRPVISLPLLRHVQHL